MMKKYFNLFFAIISIKSPLMLTSCSNTYKINKELKMHFLPWYNSLTTKDWNKDIKGNIINYYCYSETQAITLYANNYGNFWNESLHYINKKIRKILFLHFQKLIIYH